MKYEIHEITYRRNSNRGKFKIDYANAKIVDKEGLKKVQQDFINVPKNLVDSKEETKEGYNTIYTVISNNKCRKTVVKIIPQF